MTIAQTTYGKFFATQIVGGIFDPTFFMDIITGIDIFASAPDTSGVLFGAVVVNDGTTVVPANFTSEPQTNKIVKLPSVAGDLTTLSNIMGVVLYSPLIENDAAFISPVFNGYPQNYPMPVMKKGRCIVKPENTVTAASGVYVRYAASTNGSVLGAIGGVSDAGNTLVTAWSFYRGSDSNGLAVLQM